MELAELKMIVDAIQAAKFISESKSAALIEKISSLASPHQAEQLMRRLYVEGKAKTTNEKEVIGMLIIEQIYESSDIKSDYVRCPSCKKGRLCDKPAGERATVIALKPDHVGRTSSKIILKCPKCGHRFMIHLPKE